MTCELCGIAIPEMPEDASGEELLCDHCHQRIEHANDLKMNKLTRSSIMKLVKLSCGVDIDTAKLMVDEFLEDFVGKERGNPLIRIAEALEVIAEVADRGICVRLDRSCGMSPNRENGPLRHENPPRQG
jgi:hypothetical protein